ncbi:unnamed protein product [Blepharisma stoltei]|uniref:Uncharacterized protein n=1 Tax=Blepharisma stoltei TaxID=1481888 RepID=A0AAU9JAR1_9CILI|nr:unnamed protein product [Blepharisma stoltei]
MNYKHKNNESSSRSNYNEEMIKKAGLDLYISENIHLTDLLRVEYKIEATYQFIQHYIRFIASREIILLSNIPVDLNLWENYNFLVLTGDWKFFLLKKELTIIKVICVGFKDNFTEEILKIEDSIPYRAKIEVQKVILSGEYPKSYSIVLAAKWILNGQRIGNEIKVTEEGILMIIEEIKNYILSSSQISQKKLSSLLQEAGIIFKNKSEKLHEKTINPITQWLNSNQKIPEKVTYKILEKPLFDLLSIESKKAKYFSRPKDYQINLQLNPDLFEEELDKKSAYKSDTPLEFERTHLFTFEPNKDHLLTWSSDLEYSHSEDMSNSTQKLSEAITPFNLSIVDRFPKVFSDSLTLSESSNAQQLSLEQTNRKSIIDYTESLDLEYYPVEVVEIIHNSPKIKRSKISSFSTPLISPKNCNLSIQDIQKQFALLDSRITSETIDASLSDFGKGSASPVSRLETAAFSSSVDGKTPSTSYQSQDTKSKNCRCNNCEIF